MTYPDLPISVKSMLADEGMRTHHHLWHFVRSEERWNHLPQAAQEQLIELGWQAPRFETEPGSGIDFLGMHREMIAHVNHAMMAANDPNWPSVVGWDPIPWESDHTSWPVPDWQDMPEEGEWARAEATVEEMKVLVADRFRNKDYLRRVSLDQLGTAMEFSIHGWMHLRWSATPLEFENEADVDNDWLAAPWSSHVNKHFWKLHGWIDERIDDWASANEVEADLSNSWSGPSAGGHHGHHTAEAGLLKHIPSRKLMPIPMSAKVTIIEGVLEGGTPPWGEQPE